MAGLCPAKMCAGRNIAIEDTQADNTSAGIKRSDNAHRTSGCTRIDRRYGGGTEPRHHRYHHQELLDNCFLLDHNLQVRSHILVQLNGNNKLPHRLKRLVQLDLPPIDVEAFLLESLGYITSRD